MIIKKHVLSLALACATSFYLLPSYSQSNQNSSKGIRRCGTMEVLDQAIKQNPLIAEKMKAIERNTQNYIRTHGSKPSERAIVRIPVVVHVVYNTASQNISDAQINSQITVLNQDYRKMAGTPGYNTNAVGADCEIEFCLATKDPSGAATTGITRRNTTKTGFLFSSPYEVKQSTYGKVGWDYTKYLNIWVCYMTDNTLGYATFPGTETTYDGVVIGYQHFGTTGTATSPFNGGRTATHEVGHWLNLYHIWGDAYCGDDLVSDTPPSTGENYGCPTGKTSSCSGTTTDMIQNYMDYTDDACMNIFTVGQKSRMTATLNGTRASLKTSTGCSGTTTTAYCASNGQSVSDEYISKVQFGTINNTTGATAGGYNDYTATSTDVSKGTSYPITLTPGYTGSAYPEYFRVWIDYNNDKDFDDAGELAYDAGATATAAVSGNITIPSTASTAKVRMRVSMKYNGSQTQCESFQYGEVEDYSVNMLAAAATCPTPTGLSASSITSSSATLNWSAATGAVSYSIRYRINGSATWTTTTSTTTSKGITGLTASTTYEFQVSTVCSSSSSAFSASTTFATSAVTTGYCASNGQSQADEWIANVKIGTINNATGAIAGGYGNYTTIKTDITINTPTTIYLKPGYTGSAYPEYFKVWIDLNGDYDFADANEQVYDAGATATTTVSGNITIPTGTALGNKRMRVSMKYNGASTSCESFQYGEVEDYTVNVISGTVSSPVIAQVGAGTGTNNTMVYDTYYMDHRFQTILTKAELQAAGWVAGQDYVGYVAFQTTTGATQVMNAFTVKMKNVTETSFGSTSFITGATQVYQANFTAASNTWNTHTFSTAFKYDGVNNLLVEVCFNNSTYTSSSTLYGTTLTAYRTLALRTDIKDGSACANTTGTRNYFRPNMKLKFMNTASGRMSEGVDIALSEITGNGLSVYPNPTNGKILMLDNNFDGTKANTEIVNVSGQKIFETGIEEVKNNYFEKVLDLNHTDFSNLPNGVYFINITTDTKVYRNKIMLMR
ncbi:MAG: hypothetical protein A3G23_01175 [Bacteroidetes bacterium RIFCSPLOWO2_12_FULL_37_12]|nr:MAG: hypothetical protein A3G23_01175 [Bacteroidetes bacterium RIFCSPLOWO2_12_FULL_37_12]